MRPLGLLFLLALTPGLAGCVNLVPFTQQMRTDYKLTEPALRDLQYYLSGPIVLRRDATARQAQVTPQHRLRLIDGKAVEEVVIGPVTPGVVEKVEDAALAVSFEPGGQLVFVADPVTPDGPPARYRLRLDNASAPKPEVSYQNRVFVLASPPGESLLIELDRLAQVERKSRVAPGRLLP